jgi:hypothetical protein
MSSDEIGWPLSPRYEQLAAELATLIARGGSWRFICAPVVAASVEDFPDRWEANRAGIAGVVARTLWHAYLELGMRIVDVRQPAAPNRARRTRIELTKLDETEAELTLSSIGRDDVAGAVSHEIGRAFVGWLARQGAPFRTADNGLPDLTTGSIATVYLGLGVVAANSAHYDRVLREGPGWNTRLGRDIVEAGGLAVDDLAFLLAVQTTVRGDAPKSLDTLRPTQADLLARWRSALDGHREELQRLLGIAESIDESEPTRPASPTAVSVRGELDEGDLAKPYLGQRVFRFPAYRTVPVGLAGFTGTLAVALAATGVGLPIAIAAAAAGGVFGSIIGRTSKVYRCASCEGDLKHGDTTCKACGGHVAGDIAHRNDRLDREDELDDESQSSPDAVVDRSDPM